MNPPDGLVIVDKTGGWTSHDVVARVRRLAGTRRVGHAGTLDPMATGVLVVGIGRATRLLGHLALTSKCYTARIRLGQATSTDDAEGEITAATSAAGLDRAQIAVAVAALTGEIRQVPPAVSAIKVGGQRAYKLAREGAPPELAARTVTVTTLTITAIRSAGDNLDLDAEVECSSGTYIRAIARDLGTALGTGGHLTALRRTRVGPYDLSMARTLDELAVSFDALPLAQAAAAVFGRLDLTPDQARLVAHGGRLPAAVLAAAHPAPTPGSTAAPHAAAPPAALTAAPPAALAEHQAPAGRDAAGGDAPADGEAAVGGYAPARPVAAFAPDGTLLALLTAESGAARPLAVFVP